MKILVIKLGAIGDVLRTTSILKGLKEKYKAEIHWLVYERAYDILKDNDLIDKILIFNKDNIEDEYDLLINLEDNDDGFNTVEKVKYKDFIGAKKDGYTDSEWFDMGLISRFGKKKADELKAKNKKTYQKMIAEMLDINPGKMILNLQDKELDFANKFAEKNNISKNDLVIGLNTGAGKRWRLKRLSVGKTIELADKLNKGFKAKLILFGGNQEKERNDEIVKGVNFDIIDAGCDNSLLEFASLINLCNVMVTSDSLAVMIAIALKRKIVCFFTVTSAAEIELYGLGKKIISGLECICCYKRECNKKPSCVDLISVDEIVDAVKELIKDN